MARVCPLCGQPLPKALDQHELEHRLKQLVSPALASERQKLEREYRQRAAAERDAGKREAERSFQRQLAQAQQRADRAEREKLQAAERARREAEKAAERNVSQAVRLATRENEAKLEKLETTRERDRLRYEADRTKLQTQLDVMSRKLEKQTGEQLGQEAETDLLAQLQKAFAGDRMEPIGRGVKGADIVQHVIEDGKEVGRVVYESKNVSGWQNKFITQAKRYQTQYDTPNIVIVTRAFPKKTKGLCIVKGMPIVEPRMAVALASILRDGIVEIARLRITQVARDEKAQQLFDYITTDKFRTRFGEIADSVGSLREQQQKERDWHENAWEAETKLHDKIDARRREIDVQIKSITRAEVKPMVRRAAASA